MMIDMAVVSNQISVGELEAAKEGLEKGKKAIEDFAGECTRHHPSTNCRYCHRPASHCNDGCSTSVFVTPSHVHTFMLCYSHLIHLHCTSKM